MFGKRVILQLIIIVFYTITAFGQTPEYAYLVTTEVINSYNNYPITGELNMNSDVGRIEQVKYPATSSTIGNTYFDFITIPQGFSEVYVDVNQNDSRMFVFNPGVTLDTLVRAINDVGAGPGDVMAILEALEQAGALRGELIII